MSGTGYHYNEPEGRGHPEAQEGRADEDEAEGEAAPHAEARRQLGPDERAHELRPEVGRGQDAHVERAVLGGPAQPVHHEGQERPDDVDLEAEH